MKLYASILLLATLAYLTETVRVPAQMAVKATAGVCCMKMAGMKCGHAGAMGKSGACRKATGRKDSPCNNQDCNNTAGCISCPMCYMATAPAAYHTGILYPSLVADYATMPAGRPTDYSCLSWKPPDMGSFTYGPFII